MGPAVAPSTDTGMTNAPETNSAMFSATNVVPAGPTMAADTNTTPDAVIQEAVTSNRRIVDVANARGMSSTALEIFLGLVYLDYTDDPQKEAAGH